MPEKKTVNVGANEIVSASSSGPIFECAEHKIKTKNQDAYLNHLKEVKHQLTFGNYPCKMCGRIVTVVPDYIDDPSPDSGLPKDNTKFLHNKFTMIKKRPSVNRISGGLGTCDNCKSDLVKELEE